MPPGNLPQAIGRYQIVDRLGKGGMAVVYRAHDPRIGRDVAIKVLHVHGEDIHNRFTQEARSAGGLRHPGIVTIYDFGEHEGLPFIVMELVEGMTLADQIQDTEPLPLLRKLDFFLELCAALEYAHKQGVVHRDVKPSNLVIGRDGALKVLDFGIARVVNSKMTLDGTMLGTPNYMSPEQVEGRPVDRRSDVFAAGLVLYEFLTLRQAFPGETVHQIMNAIVRDRPVPIRQLCPDLDPALDVIVSRAIQKDPQKRYQTMAAMAGDIKRVRERVVSGGSKSSDPSTVKLLVRPAPTPVPTPPVQRRTPRPEPSSRELLSKRRAEMIARHLEAAGRAFDARNFAASLESAEQAALLDPDDARVIELLERARVALDAEKIASLLSQARDSLDRDAIEDAAGLVGAALEINPASDAALAFEDEIADLRRRQYERQQAIASALARARESLSSGNFESAIRAAGEILTHDPTHSEGHRLTREALQALEARRQKELAERAAKAAVADQRVEFAVGRRLAAIAALEAYAPPHEIVTAALARMRDEHAVLTQREAEEEERRRREAEEAEARRRQAAEEEEARRRKAAEEAEARRQRELAQAAARAAVAEQQAAFAAGRRLAAIAALEAYAPPHDIVTTALARMQDEHAVLTRREAEEEARRRREAEEAEARRRKAAEEEEARRRKAAEEAEARRQRELAEAAARAAVAEQQAAFAAGRRLAALEALEAYAPPHQIVTAALARMRDEHAVLTRREAEEEARRRREAEEAEARRRKAAEEEEARRQKAAEEAEARRQREIAEAAARAAVAEQQAAFAAGHRLAAIAALEQYAPPHEIVRAALARMRDEHAVLTRREAEEEARRRREAEETEARRRKAAEEEEARRRRVAEEAEARRQREIAEAAARAAVGEQQAAFAAGRRLAAIAALEAYSPVHEIVAAALATMRVEHETLERRAAEEAERREREEKERTRKEEERRRREEEEARRRKELENAEARQRQEAAAAEARRLNEAKEAEAKRRKEARDARAREKKEREEAEARARAQQKWAADQLDAGSAAIDRQEYAAAIEILEAVRGTLPEFPGLAALLQTAATRHAEAAARAEREAHIAEILARADAHIAAGQLDEARVATEAVAGEFPGRQDIADKLVAIEAASEARRRAAAHQRVAVEAAAAARRRFDEGARAEAIAALEAFTPPHEETTRACEELRAKLADLEAQAAREHAVAEAHRALRSAADALALGLVDEAGDLLERFDAFGVADPRADGIRSKLSARAEALAAERRHQELARKRTERINRLRVARGGLNAALDRARNAESSFDAIALLKQYLIVRPGDGQAVELLSSRLADMIASVEAHMANGDHERARDACDDLEALSVAPDVLAVLRQQLRQPPPVHAASASAPVVAPVAGVQARVAEITEPIGRPVEDAHAMPAPGADDYVIDPSRDPIPSVPAPPIPEAATRQGMGGGLWIAIAVSLATIVGLAWYFLSGTPDRRVDAKPPETTVATSSVPVPSTPDTASVPATTSAAEASPTDETVRVAQGHVESGDLVAAARTLAAALAADPGNAALAGALENVVERAEARAAEARRAAELARRTGRPEFVEGTNRAGSALGERRTGRANRLEPAVIAYVAAARLFNEAAQGAAVAAATASALASPPPPSPPASTAAATSVPTTAAPQGPDIATVTRLVDAYGDASSTLNLSEIQKVYPNIPNVGRQRVEALRKDYSRCEYRFSGIAVLSASGSEAIARASGIETCQPKTAQREISTLGTYQFHLRAGPSGAWTITQVFISQ